MKYFDRIALILHLLISIFVVCVSGKGEVIWAVNSGGEAHTDVNGIPYQKDTLSNGVASDYGKNLLIQRVHPSDMILYQTERYDTSSFGYSIPIKQDGDYVLVMKFSEVWFTSPGQKIFDVQLNGKHTIVDSLDIFGRVGRGVAHDEVVPFSVKNGVLKVGAETSDFSTGRLRVDFVKGERDNPKVNALYVMSGKLEDVPQLPPIPGVEHHEEEEDEEEGGDEEEKKQRRKRPTSGPRVQDPYVGDETSSMMLPIFIAMGAFFPILICLCKL